jgi:hypothetical protein
MKLYVFYNMEKNRVTRRLMQGFPAKYHAIFGIGIMSFTGPKERVSESLVKHELIHHYQAQREGWRRWNINYYRETLRFGYMDNPYEVEAYAGMYEPLTQAERQLVGLPKRRYSWMPA